MSNININPLVTCVVSSYNHEKYIYKCIKSIINQIYQNIELIIIDDGSTDNSIIEIQKTLQECKKRFVRFKYIQQSNRGLTNNLNYALMWSKGDFFCSIGSDDFMLKNKTSVLVNEILKFPNIGGVFGGCEVINDADTVLKKISPKKNLYDFNKIITRRYLIVNPSQLLKTSILKKLKGYPKDLYIDDWYMWLSITNAGYKLKVIPEILVKYRQHNNNMSKNALRMYESRKQILDFFKHHHLYLMAVSENEIYASIDLSTSSKIKSINHIFESFRLNKFIIFSKIFYIALCRVFLPKFMISFFSKIKFLVINNIFKYQNKW